MKNDIPVRQGSGNVFADLGLPQSETLMLKAQMVAAIGNLVREQGLTQNAAALKLGLKQPDVSKLLDGRFDGFSLERLFGLLIRLGQRIVVETEEAGNDNYAPEPGICFARC